jgi:hypothetical protein
LWPLVGLVFKTKGQVSFTLIDLQEESYQEIIFP